MQLLTHLKEALLHLAFPHVCEGCGTDVLDDAHELCLHCLSQLPLTQFEQFSPNPVEKILEVRMPIQHAAGILYFTKESLVQHLMHQFKYKGNKELGLYLGRFMGRLLKASPIYQNVDCLIPLPLHPSKEKKRGYNQATILCEGISDVLGKPVLKHAVVRATFTESQTRKSRVERWQNMEGRFTVESPDQVAGKHLLLVDDVITTGATLEACGRTLLEQEGTRLTVATLCVAFS
jgi:ComF family protein